MNRVQSLNTGRPDAVWVYRCEDGHEMPCRVGDPIPMLPCPKCQKPQTPTVKRVAPPLDPRIDPKMGDPRIKRGI